MVKKVRALGQTTRIIQEIREKWIALLVCSHIIITFAKRYISSLFHSTKACENQKRFNHERLFVAQNLKL